MGIRCFMWNFKGTLRNSIWNILLIHWKTYILFRYDKIKCSRVSKPVSVFEAPPLLFRIRSIWSQSHMSAELLPMYNNTLRPRQNGRRYADDTFKRIFLNENVRISIKISLKFVPRGPINNNPALVQTMARRRSGDKPLSEPMMASLLTHMCVTRAEWDKGNNKKHCERLRFYQIQPTPWFHWQKFNNDNIK